jgi:hypothetical protein
MYLRWARCLTQFFWSGHAAIALGAFMVLGYICMVFVERSASFKEATLMFLPLFGSTACLYGFLVWQHDYTWLIVIFLLLSMFFQRFIPRIGTRYRERKPRQRR